MKKISAKEATRLARNYPLSVRWSDEDQVFVGSIPGLMGDCCHGDTPEEVIPQLKDIAEDLVSFLIQKGQLLPAPSTVTSNPDPVAIRSAMGLSQTKFAQLIGVSVRYFAQMGTAYQQPERSRQDPPEDRRHQSTLRSRGASFRVIILSV